MSQIIGRKYKLIQKYGTGQFSTVCRGVCLQSNKQVAIKMERSTVEYPLLKHEVNLLYYLAKQKCPCIPQVLYYGYQSPYMCLVMTFYEEGSLNSWKPDLSLQDILEWWNCAIDILMHIHKAGIVHRDLKPAHFMRKVETNSWHLIDFGLATTYWNTDNQHIENRTKEHLLGSPLYVSYYVHEGNELVRRDDFLSLVYIGWELWFGEPVTGAAVPPPTIVSRQSTYLQDPYNEWLKQEKSFTTLYSRLTQYESRRGHAYISPKWIQFFHFLLKHAELLEFSEKPLYGGFIIQHNNDTSDSERSSLSGSSCTSENSK